MPVKTLACHSLPSDMGEEGIMKKKRLTMTQGGVGSKIWHFRCDVMFEWSHTSVK